MRFSKPDKLPEWASSDIIDPITGMNNVVEPNQEKKSYGWLPFEEPPRNWFNWVARFTYLWLGYLEGFKGRVTTAGGSATQTFSVPGVAVGDICLVTINQTGVTPRTIVEAKALTNSLEVLFSGDPSGDHIISYQIIANS